MRLRNLLWLVPTAAVLLLVLPTGALAQPVNSVSPNVTIAAQGAVFTMTNNPHHNAVLAYAIGPGGALIPVGQFSTHGKGTGGSLADQNAITLTNDHHWLLVINAGSNSISVFRVNSLSRNGPILAFVDQVWSHGPVPVSIAVHGSFVYVLNAGSTTVAGNIFGFFLADQGLLFPLPGSSRALSTSTSTEPAEIAFNPAGNALVVTEKATSSIDTYLVGHQGYVSGPTVASSNGATPYGFAFGRAGTLVVSDAGPGGLSSYSISNSGTLTAKSGPVLDGQVAACWVATTDGGRIAFTSNADSMSISSYRVGTHGGLSLISSVAATTGAGDTDLAIGGSHNQYLFVHDGSADELEEFAIGSHGGLTQLYAVFAVSPTAEGLAAF
ncbi:MAG: beta-propeller fold lactonase family protein [Thermoplasmata archaeon]